MRLGVNVDHVATLRQARRVGYPDPVEAALRAEEVGAHNITVHLREDRRHIQEADVEALVRRLRIPVNLEMAVTDAMVETALRLRPPRVCLVPERREELTTEGGLDVQGQAARIGAVTARLVGAGIRVSHFVDPEVEQLSAALAAGAHAVELHTGQYANAADETARRRELERLREAAKDGVSLGLEVHAGHGLTVANVRPITAIPDIAELNIGHSIVARAVFIGFAGAVREMLDALGAAEPRSGRG
jgi:pyridoxine 5-phosphate synthase